VSGGKSKSSRLADKGTGEVYGHRTKFFTEKNKRSAPYRSAEVDLIYGLGYDNVGEIIDIGVDVGLVEQSGAWYNYKDHKWQGKEKAKLALHADEGLRKEMETKLRAIISGEVFEVPAPPEGPENDTIEENGEIKNDKPARKKRVAKSEASVS